MKISLLYSIGFVIFVGIYFTVLSTQESPESSIIGEWREVSWEYEKIDSLAFGEGFDYMVTDRIKNDVSKDLIIHEAEIWEFVDKETVEMKGENEAKSLNWRLKGRGNILQLNDRDNHEEHYLIQELSSDRMILHFNIDMQVRGIVKMTFEKVNRENA